MKRVAPIALEAVCLGTSVLDSNCSEPLRWLFGAGEYGAGVRTLLWGLHPPGIPCWGVRQRDGSFGVGCWRLVGLGCFVMLVRLGVNGLRRCASPRSGFLRSDPTRLETRTEESNMCASVRVANPDAQRNREEGPVYGAPPAAPDLL